MANVVYFGVQPIADSGLGSISSTLATLDVPSSAPRERTPPTPLETPASPGSSTSTLIMDATEAPLFYQPPPPRHAPIQPKTAEEVRNLSIRSDGMLILI